MQTQNSIPATKPMGRLFTEQKCPICKACLVHDRARRGLFCPVHREVEATGRFTVQFGRNFRKRFKDYTTAARFLEVLRYEKDAGTLDLNEYRHDSPLAFNRAADRYLEKREGHVEDGSLAYGTYRNIVQYLRVAQEFFGERSVKKMRYAHFEDFADSLTGVGNKTKSNYLSALSDMFTWLYKREEIDRVPVFPRPRYQLARRRTLDKHTQFEVLAEVARISAHINPKIALGVRLLRTYYSIRPAEMRGILIGNIDKRGGVVHIPRPKERKWKAVPFLKEDLEEMCALIAPDAGPEDYYFCHGQNLCNYGVVAGQRFGINYFSKWWNKACENLGVVGVSLYPGTKHSSVTGLRGRVPASDIQKAGFLSTSQAFGRYYMDDPDYMRHIYSLTKELEKPF